MLILQNGTIYDIHLTHKVYASSKMALKDLEYVRLNKWLRKEYVFIEKIGPAKGKENMLSSNNYYTLDEDPIHVSYLYIMYCFWFSPTPA